MILNISGRTDIVAFYTPWLMNRIKAGFFDVRNPFNPQLVSRIYYDNVDALLFCTKNPNPIIPFLKDLDKPIEFQVTLTPFKNDIEPGVINKTKVIEGIKEVSKIIGKKHISVRYDPVFISEKYNVAYHKAAFKKMCELLNGYVERIIVSFIDDYKNVRNNLKELNMIPFNDEIYREIGTSFAQSAKENNMTVQTCFEEINLLEYGFIKGECISHKLAFELTGKAYKDWTARKGGKCGCVQTVDIGVYNSCQHFCKYCYANFDEKQVKDNFKEHDPNSSLLVGHLKPDDIIKERFK